MRFWIAEDSVGTHCLHQKEFEGWYDTTWTKYVHRFNLASIIALNG